MAGAGAQALGFASSCPLTAATPGGKSRLGLRPAGEGRRSYSVQLSTDSMNAVLYPGPHGRRRPQSERAGRLVRKRMAGASRIPLPLVRPWPGRGLSAAPGSPRCSRAESPRARRGAARLCLGVPLPPGGSTPQSAQKLRELVSRQSWREGALEQTSLLSSRSAEALPRAAA